jgi:hypothetical protein
MQLSASRPIARFAAATLLMGTKGRSIAIWVMARCRSSEIWLRFVKRPFGHSGRLADRPRESAVHAEHLHGARWKWLSEK